MGELYGGREAEIGRSLKITRVEESREQESPEGSGNSIRIVDQREDFGVRNCEGLLEFNLHVSVPYCVVILVGAPSSHRGQFFFFPSEISVPPPAWY